MNTEPEKNPDLPPIINGPPPIPVAAPPPIPARKKSSPWIWIVFVVVFCIAGFIGFRMVQYMQAHPSKAEPGEVEFREANQEIIAGHASAGFGNNAEARALAEEYSKGMKIFRDNLITKGDPTAVGSLEGDFLTYCQLNDDSCVFLVHVPELRRFTDEAKKTMTAAAWINAQSVIQSKIQQPPKTVVVGVKGLVFYDAILTGDYGKDGFSTRGSGLEGMKLFYPYFAAKDKSSPLPETNENNPTK